VNTTIVNDTRTIVNDTRTSVNDAAANAEARGRTTPERPDAPPVRRAKAAILRIGELLHGSREDVVAFTEAVTGVAWAACDRDDLDAVLAEYRAILQAIGEKQARRIARSQKSGTKGANYA